jgi:catechol 2,3-dioxygenase-like lactoylglutathione lyase family enzyme
MSQSENAPTGATRFEGVTPILRVRSVASSIEYYVRVLGFKLDWGGGEKFFASVSRDRCHIFLSEDDQGNPGTWVWVGVEDAAALHEEYLTKGAKVRHPPTNYEWAYEIQIEDLDGNVLRMGSDPLADQPFGEWLDMHGDVWVSTPDGDFTRVKRS